MAIVALLIFAACSNGAAGTPAPALDPQFDAWWHDGKAELSGYSLTVDRYGHATSGTAVLIYVTEPFSKSKHVKVDDPSKHPEDAADVLKLNFVRHFQTGLYDYTTMGSTFAALPELNLLKSAFSSTEWCGQVYEQLDVSKGQLAFRFDSYFEGESAEGAVKIPAGGLVEDELFVRLRGFAGSYLPVGESRTTPFLPSSFYRRLAHHGLEWGEVTIRRAPDGTADIGGADVGTASIATERYELRTSDGREGLFSVEIAWPRRIVGWTWTGPAGFAGGTDAGKLLATERMPYWELHNPGDEALLAKLGLPVPAAP